SINRLQREPWIGTHLATERMHGRERRLAFATGATDNVADIESALTELHTQSTAPHIRAKADAMSVDLPEAECIGASTNSICIRVCAIVRGEIPWHDTIGDPRTPLEISVCALPCVAHDETRAGHVAAPAEIQSFYRDRRRRKRHVKRPGAYRCRDEHAAVARPFLARVAIERLIACGRLDDHPIRHAKQIEEAAARLRFG